MPYKKGPNNTLRFYSKSTGRYCNDPRTEIIIDNKKETSYIEKEKLRRETLFNIAKKSKDVNLFEIYEILESINPGCVRHVNSHYYDKASQKNREFDIITSKAIYEIKHGRGKHHFNQFLSQIKVAKSLNKDHVVFSPGSTNYQIKCMRRMGINAFNKIEELFESEKKRKC